MEADDPRLAFCPLLLAEIGIGRCSAAYDCAECDTFYDATEDLDVQWLCSRCLPPGSKLSPMTLLGYYNDQECDECGERSVLCQAAVDPDEMTRENWRKILLDPLRPSE